MMMMMMEDISRKVVLKISSRFASAEINYFSMFLDIYITFLTHLDSFFFT